MTVKYSALALLAVCSLSLHAAEGGAVAQKEEAFTKKECLSVLRRQADHGDGNAAKVLAIYYGTDARNDALALAFLKEAIDHGMDVSDVPKRKTADVMEVCRRDPALQAMIQAGKPARKIVEAPTVKTAKADKTGEASKGAKSAEVRAKVVEPKVPEAAKVASVPAKPEHVGNTEVATVTAPVAQPAPKPAPATVAVRPPESAARTKPSNAEFERLAADAEWGGKVSDALKYWEKAREGGSRAAAKRLYQIYSFGSGDVEPDYVKAIEASQIAERMGLEVPPLPRK